MGDYFTVSEIFKRQSDIGCVCSSKGRRECSRIDLADMVDKITRSRVHEVVSFSSSMRRKPEGLAKKE